MLGRDLGVTCTLVHADDKQGQKLTKAEAFLAGGVARAAAAAATCPFTVVKTRMEYAGSRVQYTVTHFKHTATSRDICLVTAGTKCDI